ncbi:MAG: DNA primase TraC [Alphaproteobacteria bacterium ADurb.Bin438]|nr:MAG: DNA primase TraC [Alphaproteobacteria bacterium ADurb.Bin438]
MSEKKYLNVPYEEKDEAKALGAKWDVNAKKWYCPEDIDINIFEKWSLERNDYYNVSVEKFYIVTGRRRCWKCDKDTDIYSIALPYDYIYHYDDKQEKLHYPNLTMIRRVKLISPEASDIIKREVPLFRDDYSHTIKENYFISHCMHCDAKQGDFMLFEEIDTHLLWLYKKRERRVKVKRTPVKFLVSDFHKASFLNPRSFWEKFWKY